MDDTTRAAIETRINELRAERDRYINEVNARVGAYNGAIGELERMIADASPNVEAIPEVQ